MCASNKKKAHLFTFQHVKAKHKNIRKSWEQKLLQQPTGFAERIYKAT